MLDLSRGRHAGATVLGEGEISPPLLERGDPGGQGAARRLIISAYHDFIGHQKQGQTMSAHPFQN